MRAWLLGAVVLGLGAAFGCSDSSNEPGGSGGSEADAGNAGTPGEGGAGNQGGIGGKGGTSGNGGTAGRGGTPGDGGMPGAGTSGDAGAAGSGGESGSSAGSGGYAGTPSGGMGGGGSQGTGQPTPIPVVERGDEICGAAPGGSQSGTHHMRFENAEADITVQISRIFLGQGVGHSSIYGLSAFSLLLDGQEHCSGDPGDITETSYSNTHHNWQDRASATLEGVRYDLFLGLDIDDQGDIGDWALTLSATETGSGALVLEPTPLVATGGPVACWGCPGMGVSVLVSEVMASNESTLEDAQGEYEPWIELFNPSSAAVNLQGWTLSNALDDRTRWAFPDVVIPRHGYLVVFADGQPEQGNLHTSFELSPEGGAVILTAPDGVTNGGLAFGPQEADRSFGYAAESYVWMPEPTPGEENPKFEW